MNIEQVKLYTEWDRHYQDFQRGKVTLQGIVAQLPRELGIKYRQQVLRIFHKRYGGTVATSRRSNSLTRSLAKDYPELDLNRLNIPRESTRYYSRSELSNISKYANKLLSRSSEGQYIMRYSESLAEGRRHEYDERYRYSKSGLLLPYFMLFVNTLTDALASMATDEVMGLLDISSLLRLPSTDEE